MYKRCEQCKNVTDKLSSVMGRDDSWSATVLSVVPSYSHVDSNLIGPAQSGFPMSWFFPTLGRHTFRELHFRISCGNRPKWRNRTSDLNLMADSESGSPDSYSSFLVTIRLSRLVRRYSRVSDRRADVVMDGQRGPLM